MRVHTVLLLPVVLLAVLCRPAAGSYSITDLGMLPGGVDVALAYGINGAGQVVGVSDDASGEDPCLWQNGTVTDLGTLPGGGVSVAYGINNAGQIVGESFDASGNEHACLWQNGAITDLGAFPGCYISAAYAINDAGQIVGFSYPASGYEHACLWQNGTITDLGTLPGDSYSEAQGINDAGQIVGVSGGHACLWQNGTITDLGTLPGGGISIAEAINDAGQIVGLSCVGANEYACLWQNGTITDLGTLPGDAGSLAYAINNAGQIVGCSSTASAYSHACLWQSGTITDLGALPGDDGSVALGINDAGQIVGASFFWSEHACLWQPEVGGPSIDSFILTPSTLSSTTSVTATVTTTSATWVTLSIAGLDIDQPTVTLNWNGSAWTASISGSLAKWARSNSLSVTVTAYDDHGGTANATRALPVDTGQPPPGDIGDPNAIWVDDSNGCGIFTGSDQVLGIGPPFTADLSMTTVVTSLFGQDGPMNLWPHIVRTTSGEAAVASTQGSALGAVLSQVDRCSPSGGPTYEGTFWTVNDTASFTAHMDATVFWLTALDTIVNAVSTLYPGVPDVSPSTLVQTYDAFANLAPVQSALARFDPMPSPAHVPGAILGAACDLGELVTNSYEREALRQVLETELRIATGDPTLELTGPKWLKAVDQVFSYWQLLKIWRDLLVWADTTQDGDPQLVYHVYRTHTGSPQLIASSTGLGLSSVVGAPSTSLTYDEAETPSGAAYTFTVTNTGAAPVWEFRMELTPSSPEPTAISAPAGWQGEIIWDDTDHYVRWYTQGPGGWASGDFGAGVIAQSASLSGFQVTLPQGLTQTTYLTMDTDLKMDAGMLAMTPGLLAAPPDFAPGAGETADLDAYLDRAANAGVTIYKDGLPYRALSAPTSPSAGEFTVTWDGKEDQDGKLAPVGDYEAHLDITYVDLTATTVTAPMLVAFSDVPWDFWAHDQIYAAVRAKVVQGYPDDSYQPGTIVTRDQMAVYISRALAGGDANVPGGPAGATFSDVPADYWAYKYIEYAFGQKVVEGYSDGTYKPTDQVDRGQMAVFIARSIYTPTAARLDLTGYTPPATATFPDVPADFWAYTYVEYIAQPTIAVTQGYPDGNYHPEYTCTRDQMAVYVTRAFKLMGTVNVLATIQGPPVGSLAADIQLRFYAPGSTAMPVYTTTAALDGSGKAILGLGLPYGTYDVWGKVPTHLARRVRGWSFGNGRALLDFGMLLAGDLVNDNVVNQADLDYMTAHWLTNDPIADINRDGVVNSIDFAILNSNWGKMGDP